MGICRPFIKLTIITISKNADIVKNLKFSRNVASLVILRKKMTFNFTKSMFMDMFRSFIKLTIIMIFKNAHIVKNLKFPQNEHLSHLLSL